MRLIAALLFIAPTISFAQKDTTRVLNEVTVIADRLFDKETAGAKETHVDSTVLQVNLNHTLSELLSDNTPIFIKSYGRGSMATASFRGTAPSHTQVLWNGMSINSPMLGMVDFSLLPVYFIDDLTLKHGGASTEDIGGALGGSISMSNKPDWNNKISGRYVQGIGSFKTTEEFVQLNAGSGRLQSKTRAYYTYSKNNFRFLNDQQLPNVRQRNDNAAYKMYSIMQELYGKINEHSTLSFNAWYHDAKRSLPRLNSYEGDKNSNINQQFDRTWRLNGSWDRHYQKSTLTVTSGAQLQNVDYFLYNQVIGLGLVTSISSLSNSNSLFNRVQLKHNSFDIKVNYNYHTVHSHESINKTGYDKKRNEILMYAGYYKKFSDKLNIRASIREDYVDDTFIPVIPFLGFDLKLRNDKKFYLKGNVTRNYHVPTLNDLYWQPGGNPNLVPEQGVSEELTIAHLTNAPNLNVELQLTGFHSDITNWIVWVPTGRGSEWTAINVKRVRSNGIEFAVKLRKSLGPFHFALNGNYAFTRSLNFGDRKTWGDESYGKQLVYIPLHSGNAFINARYKTYSITWQYTSYSKRFTTSSNDLTAYSSLADYFMNQLYLSKEFKVKKVTFETQLKVYNLFDEYYRSVLSRRMPGRNYMLLLMARF